MIKYIIGTLIILWVRLLNMKLFNRTKIVRIEPTVPWYRQLIWFYSPPTKILSNLYLGSSFNAYDIEQINKLNINVIINVTEEIDNFYESNLKLTYYKYPIADNNVDNISEILSDSFEIISSHINSADKILVHCYMGASRSASVVINYLIKHKNMNWKEAKDFVISKRPIVNLSETFASTLKQVQV